MTKKLLAQVLFYGSIWGILEATLGHVLHFIPATIAGAIMFPIAGAILYKAYENTDSKAALFYIGIVAASIKSIDLLLPQLSIYKTINPMISILLESLIVVVVVVMLTSKKPVLKYSALPVASIAWRTLFIGWMFLLHTTTGLKVPYLSSFMVAFDFVVISGLLSGVIGSLFIFTLDRVHIKTLKLSNRYDLALGLFAIALVTTYML